MLDVGHPKLAVLLLSHPKILATLMKHVKQHACGLDSPIHSAVFHTWDAGFGCTPNRLIYIYLSSACISSLSFTVNNRKKPAIIQKLL